MESRIATAQASAMVRDLQQLRVPGKAAAVAIGVDGSLQLVEPLALSASG